MLCGLSFFFFSSRRRHTRSLCDWSSDVCSSDLSPKQEVAKTHGRVARQQVIHEGQVSQRLAHLLPGHTDRASVRSEERRVGKEGRCRGWLYHESKKTEDHSTQTDDSTRQDQQST